MGKLILLYGINAVGKDTVALELSKLNKNTIIVSDQRILMYHLGLIKNYKSNIKINREKYKILENTPDSILENIYQIKFLKTIKELTKENDLVFLISHLVISLHVGKNEPTYLDTEKINKKLHDLLSFADGIFYIKSKPADVLSRRMKDLLLVERNRPIKLDDIRRHQELNDKKWKELLMYVPHDKTHVMLNDDNNLNKVVLQGQVFLNKILNVTP